MKFWKSFWQDEDGQTLIEYALLIGLVVLIVIATLRAFGVSIVDKFNEIMQTFNEEVNTGPGGSIP